MKHVPGRDALIEVFGTPKPDNEVVRKWKYSWRTTKPSVEVASMTEAYRRMEELGIDPLFYQVVIGDNRFASSRSAHIIFWNPEHQILYKLGA